MPSSPLPYKPLKTPSPIPTANHISGKGAELDPSTEDADAELSAVTRQRQTDVPLRDGRGGQVLF